MLLALRCTTVPAKSINHPSPFRQDCLNFLQLITSERTGNSSTQASFHNWRRRRRTWSHYTLIYFLLIISTKKSKIFTIIPGNCHKHSLSRNSTVRSIPHYTTLHYTALYQPKPKPKPNQSNPAKDSLIPPPIAELLTFSQFQISVTHQFREAIIHLVATPYSLISNWNINDNHQAEIQLIS